MPIISLQFAIFLSLILLVYFCLPARLQWVWLLCGSFFYIIMASDLEMTMVFTIIVLFTWITAKAIMAQKKQGKRSALLGIGLLFQFGGLFFFKYGDFFAGTINGIGKTLDMDIGLTGWSVEAPVGVSYFMLMLMGYILDVYWGKYPAENNPAKLALFAGFFPALTSGPFMRYDTMNGQWFGDQKHKLSYQNLTLGLQRILWGLFKKLVIASRAQIIVDTIYGDFDTYQGFYIWVAVFVFVIQLYTDFSGLMDIVLGVAEIMGIYLPENFKAPFFSISVSEFWRRWHITLNEWLRDYLFNPLQRCSVLRNFRKWMRKHCRKEYEKYFNVPLYIALFVTWFAVGFWHGGKWKYIIGVGLWMWLVIVLGMIFAPLFKWIVRRLGINTDCFSWRLFQRIRTLLVFSVGLSFFRAEGLGKVYLMWSRAFADNIWILFDQSLYELGLDAVNVHVLFWGIGGVLAVDYLSTRYDVRAVIARQNFVFRCIVWLVLMLIVVMLGLYGRNYDTSSFIYAGF